MRERERFSSRFGFIIVSISCAIGLGNVWLMPYRAGMYGGALYILLVFAFLFALSVPVLLIEYAIGRGSGLSATRAFHKLEPKGTKWHFIGYIAVIGNYLLLMFFTVVCGIILMYFWRAVTGELIGASPEEIGVAFGAVTSRAGLMYGLTFLVILFCLGCCFAGLKQGVERVSKYMMGTFFFVAIALLIRALTLPGAYEGVRFLLIPNLDAIQEHGVMRILHLAMGQALFSLSVGIGCMLIFGSYASRAKRLSGEALTVGVLDFTVIMLMLFVIFPAAFAFGIPATAGEALLFVTMPNVLNAMPGAYVWSVVFYAGLFFVAVSTAIAVMECIVAMTMDKFGWTRKKAVLANLVIMAILIMPGAFGRNIWAPATPILGAFPHWGSFFTFLVMENVLPLGSFFMLLFVRRNGSGWGWDNFLANANMGSTGWVFPSGMRIYVGYILPTVIGFIFVWGHLQRWVFPQLGWFGFGG